MPAKINLKHNVFFIFSRFLKIFYLFGCFHKAHTVLNFLKDTHFTFFPCDHHAVCLIPRSHDIATYAGTVPGCGDFSKSGNFKIRGNQRVLIVSFTWGCAPFFPCGKFFLPPWQLGSANLLS